MQQQPHVIEERGLVVYDGIHNMPSYDEPFTTPYMVITLNVKGWVRAECDMQPVYFQPHDIAILPPRHILCAHESSADYHAILIAMSVPFQEEMKRLYPDIYLDNFHYIHQPAIPLNEEQFATVHQLILMIQTVSRIDNSSRRWSMLGDLLNVLFLLLQDYRQQNGINKEQLSAHEKLFIRFFKAITEHYTESREVHFYADLFHLTPKYFATIIKQHTNTNALEWINGYVTIQAKMLLRNQMQLTVQEIALQLGFPDQASFSRFFKTHTGMSPTEYRAQL